MHQQDNIMISVEHCHTLRMLSGTKTAEIRRRKLRVRSGARLWVYSKLPRGRVELVATVDEVVVAPPARLWKTYGKRIAIDPLEFRAYLKGVDVACLILMRDITPLTPSLRLDVLRQISRDFHPPQFFRHLIVDEPIFKRLVASYTPA